MSLFGQRIGAQRRDVGGEREAQEGVSSAGPLVVSAELTNQANETAALDADDIERLSRLAKKYTSELCEAHLQSATFRERTRAFSDLGLKATRNCSSIADNLLRTPTRVLDSGAAGPAAALADLRTLITELDPASRGDLLARKKLLGFIPWGIEADQYFAEYEKLAPRLEATLNALRRAQDDVRLRNAAVEQDLDNLVSGMRELRRFVVLGQALEDALVSALEELKYTESEKAQAVEDEALYAIRQRLEDMLTQNIVCTQGYAALELARKNNLALVRGLERAATTTIAALQSAVLVSSAVCGDELLLQRVRMLGSATANLVESSAGELRRVARAEEGNAGSGIDNLCSAFSETLLALDTIERDQERAVGTLRQSLSGYALAAEQAQDSSAVQRTDGQSTLFDELVAAGR